MSLSLVEKQFNLSAGADEDRDAFDLTRWWERHRRLPWESRVGRGKTHEGLRDAPMDSLADAAVADAGVGAEEVSSFLAGLDSHCTLPQKERDKIRDDFRAALRYYVATGVPLREAFARLDMANLGGFYARPPVVWYELDDGAKIYPLAMRHGHMEVFRLSVRFTSDVVPELLQMALTFTIKRFPMFATTVKKGFFWHYLDAAKHRYAIQPEGAMPCQPLAISGSAAQPFRVLYYRNRVSVEYFHALTDGFGGMVFLKALTIEYLRLLGVTVSADGALPDVNDLPTASEAVNEFARRGKSGNVLDFVAKPAVQMSGRLSAVTPCRVLHFRLDAGRLKAAARARNATVTAYLLALIFVASRHATDDTEGSMSVKVPINLRQYHPSGTLRNFVACCGVRLPVGDIVGVDQIVPEVSRQLRQRTSRQAVDELLDSTRRLVNVMRWVPVFLKAPVAKIVYGLLGDTVYSNTLSNLGVVSLPPEVAGHVDSLDVVLNGAQTNRAGCAIVTFGEVAMLSITKTTADPSFEDTLYELLLRDGVVVAVEGSALYAN